MRCDELGLAVSADDLGPARVRLGVHGEHHTAIGGMQLRSVGRHRQTDRSVAARPSTVWAWMT